MAIKRNRDPRQLSFNFDVMMDHIERLHEENAVDATAVTYQASSSTNLPEYVCLGLNGRGETVYTLQDGSRMISRNPAIMQMVDGDKDTPKTLYDRKKRQYLTVEEIKDFEEADKLSAKKTQQSLPLEVQRDRRTDSPSRNSRQSSQARNHPRNQIGRVHQFGLFDFGQMGAEQPGHAESTGSERGLVRIDPPQPAAIGGTPGADQRHGLGDEPSRDERLGDFGTVRDRYRVENYRIDPDDRLGVGGAKAKYADNIAAIRLLQELQSQRAQEASPEEKRIFVRYVGWGGLPQVFDSNNDKWTDEYKELQSLLPPDDYAKARRSTQDAHYTSETVIRGIWQGLARMGLSDDNPRILEPSAGIGNFVGLCPENLNPQFLAVELDPTSSAIAQYLYPETRHINNGFQNSGLTPSVFDVAIGNPPFGSQSLYDPDFPELRSFSIHNYFLAKSISLLREGGVAAFVVSRFFLDAVDPTVREHIAGYADFLGAVRLPETAFKENALTEVTADIVFFQKNSGEKFHSRDWVHTADIEVDDLKEGGQRTVAINSFYTRRPDQIIGKMILSGGMYRDSLNCVGDPSLDLGAEIEKRLGVLPQEVYIPREEAEEKRAAAKKYNEAFIASPYFQSLKLDAFSVEPQSRKIVFKTAGLFGDSAYAFLSVKNDTARQRITAMIQIRDTLRELINAEKSDAEESDIETARRQLNVHYDAFAKRYGHLNSQTNRSLMRNDPEHSLLESLEVEYDKGLSPEAARRQGRSTRPSSARKAAIFRQRVLKPAQAVDHAESAQDALVIALREVRAFIRSRP
jgi:predicted RNA methylase